MKRPPKTPEQQEAARKIMERRYRNPKVRQLALYEWLIMDYRSSRQGG